jgi:hypothetical protein
MAPAAAERREARTTKANLTKPRVFEVCNRLIQRRMTVSRLPSTTARSNLCGIGEVAVAAGERDQRAHGTAACLRVTRCTQFMPAAVTPAGTLEVFATDSSAGVPSQRPENRCFSTDNASCATSVTRRSERAQPFWHGLCTKGRRRKFDAAGGCVHESAQRRCTIACHQQRGVRWLWLA